MNPVILPHWGQQKTLKILAFKLVKAAVWVWGRVLRTPGELVGFPTPLPALNCGRVSGLLERNKSHGWEVRRKARGRLHDQEKGRRGGRSERMDLTGCRPMD